MKKYILNLIWLLADRAFMLVFQVLLFATIKRSFGVEVLGAWATINNISQILLSIFLLGIDVVVIKRIIESSENAKYELGSAILVQFGGLIVYSICLLVVVKNLYSNVEGAFYFSLILVIGNLFSVLTKAIFWHYTAMLESKYRAITIALSAMLTLCYLFTAKSINPTLIFSSFAVFYALQMIVALIIYFTLYKKSVFWKPKKDIAIYYCVIGSKLILSTISVALFVQADLLMLEKLSGLEEAGYFSAALRISTIWFMMAGILAGAFYPKIVELAKNKNKTLRLMEVMSSYAIFIALAASILASIFGGWVIELIYGKGMDKSAEILQIHIWSGIFIFMGAFSSKWLYANELINYDIAKTAFAAFFNVAVNLMIIPKYGAIGAAWVSLLSYFIANYLFFFFFTETRDIFIIKTKSIINSFNIYKLYRFAGEIKCLFRS